MRSLQFGFGLLILFATIGCGSEPRFGPSYFEIKAIEGGVRADFPTLGSYPTTFTSIEIRRVDSGAVVWLVRSTATSQVHGIDLRHGANPATPPYMYGSKEVDVFVPRGTETFLLEKGPEYQIEVCFPGRWKIWCERGRFRV